MSATLRARLLLIAALALAGCGIKGDPISPQEAEEKRAKEAAEAAATTE